MAYRLYVHHTDLLLDEHSGGWRTPNAQAWIK